MEELKMGEQENGTMQKPVTPAWTLSHDEREEITFELHSLAGFLDMIYLITEGDLWSVHSDDVKFTILEARDKASALAERL
jgi:hypothetical protein